MDGRFRREDLERLLELVDTRPAPSVHGDGVLAAAPALSPLNHQIWIDRLRTETGGTWDDDLYLDAANILEIANHQQSVFQSFNSALRQAFPGPESDTVPEIDAAAGVVSRAVAAGYISSDQIISWPAADPASGVSAQSAGAALPDLAHVPSADTVGFMPEPVGPNRQGSLAAITGDRGRDGESAVFSVVRSNLFLQTGLAFLQPYQNWDDFQSRNSLPSDLIQDLKSAYPDGLEKMDLWVGGLAEAPLGSLLGPTLAAAVQEQLGNGRLLNASGDAQLPGDIPHTSEIHSTDYSDFAMRPTGEMNAGDAHTSDALAGATGAKFLVGSSGSDVLRGSDGDDIILGLGGNDLLFGGGGNDILDGGTGADVLAGEYGDDTYRVDDTFDQVMEAAGEGTDTVETNLDAYDTPDNVENITYTGSRGFSGSGNQLNNTITGGSANDRLAGNGGDDVLTGGGGNDLLEGGAGDDHLSGGDGNDILAGGSGSDVISGGDGDDVITGGDLEDAVDCLALDAVADDVPDSSPPIGATNSLAIEPVSMSSEAPAGSSTDTIVINGPAAAVPETEASGESSINEPSLNIRIVSENIDILVQVGTGDTLGGNQQDPAFTLTLTAPGTEPATGASEVGSASGSVVPDEHGNLVLNGDPADSEAAESLVEMPAAPAGFDLIIFVGGGDSGVSDRDILDALAGQITGDVLDGGAGNDRVFGGDGDDLVLGGDGEDTVCGGEGDDTIDGGEGNDWVISDQGNDYILFTRGSDTISLRPGFGNDVVIGFDSQSSGPGGQDRIDVSAYGFAEDAFGSAILLIYDGEATIVQIGGDSLRLMLTDLETMDRNDFIFS